MYISRKSDVWKTEDIFTPVFLSRSWRVCSRPFVVFRLQVYSTNCVCLFRPEKNKLYEICLPSNYDVSRERSSFRHFFTLLLWALELARRWLFVSRRCTIFIFRHKLLFSNEKFHMKNVPKNFTLCICARSSDAILSLKSFDTSYFFPNQRALKRPRIQTRKTSCVTTSFSLPIMWLLWICY